MSCRLVTRFFLEQERPETGGFLAFFRESGIAFRETAVPAMQGNRSPVAAGFAQYVGQSCPTEFLRELVNPKGSFCDPTRRL